VAHKNLGAICLILAAEIPTGISPGTSPNAHSV
jgi:hypothetical protein